VDERRTRELVAGERRRIEAALGELTGDLRADETLETEQTGESAESGSHLEAEMVETALIANLRDQLRAVERAEERLAQGTFGRSVESGLPIPDERLEVEPLAERTVQEQGRFERGVA
jgi:DnaK suppressor protein